MKTPPHSENPPTGVLVSFRDRFAASPQFAKLYAEGMALVDETADYLDREGRAESKRLAPPASHAYSSESIRLTTRLTQLASWLLVQRAIASGEITADQAHTHRHRVTLMPQSMHQPEGYSDLPETFKRLIADSYRLHDRILRLHRLLSDHAEHAVDGSPLSPNIQRIRFAFPAA